MKSADGIVMLEPGTLCRTKDAIIKCENDEQGRLCRVIGVVPVERWRIPGVPEYKVELVALPVTAFRRQGDLIPALPADFAMFSGEASAQQPA